MRREEDWISYPYDAGPLIMIPTFAADHWEGNPSDAFNNVLAVWGYVGIIMFNSARCIVLNDIPMPTTIANVDGFTTIVRWICGSDLNAFAEAIEQCKFSEMDFQDQLLYHEASEFVIFDSQYKYSEVQEKLFVTIESPRFYIRAYDYEPNENISAVLHPLIPLPNKE